jgi:lipoprotein NlpD
VSGDLAHFVNCAKLPLQGKLMTVDFLRKLAAACAVVVLVAGCASNTRGAGRAPVEDRGASAGPGAISVGSGNSSGTPTASIKPLPGAENAGKPGYYSVRPGDTLIRIALETGQNWRDIARWNNLDNPNLIEVGQVLRVVAPVGATAVAAGPAGTATAATNSTPSAAPAVAVGPATAAPGATVPNGTETITRPVVGSTVSPLASPTSPAAPATSPAAPATRAASAPSTVASGPASPASADEEPSFIWPASGSVVASFDEAKNKGLDIAGKAGDPVLAAADGRVVYAGAGLRGYGNLIIVQHNKTYLTAYAHNQTLLVREDQSVRKGQKIAEMGSSDADRVKLHFEVRKQGRPVDPAKVLPNR